MFEKLKNKWKITSNFQFAIILVVFAITGSLSALISEPICTWLGITAESFGFWYALVRILIIFPVYQLLLVINGFLFGQFKFFWSFEKKMLQRLGFGFLLKKL